MKPGETTLGGFAPPAPAPPAPAAPPAPPLLGVGRCATRGPRMIRGPPVLVPGAPVPPADDSRRSEDPTDGVRDGGDDVRRPRPAPVGVLRPLVGGDVGLCGLRDVGLCGLCVVGLCGLCDVEDGDVTGGDGEDVARVVSTACLTGSPAAGVSANAVGVCSGC